MIKSPDMIKCFNAFIYQAEDIIHRKKPEIKGTEEASSGSASFKFPPGCSSEDCTYTAEVKVSGEYVEVEVTNKVGEGMWTAVGFSSDQSMVGQIQGDHSQW